MPTNSLYKPPNARMNALYTNGSLSYRNKQHIDWYNEHSTNLGEAEEARINEHAAACVRDFPKGGDDFDACIDKYAPNANSSSGGAAKRKAFKLMTVAQLQKVARARSLPGRSRMCKDELIAALGRHRNLAQR